MGNHTGRTALKRNAGRVFVILAAILIFSACGNPGLNVKKQQFEKMPDEDLLRYYHQLDERLDNIDKATEEQKVMGNYNDDPEWDRIRHLHVGDTWYQLRQEKTLVLKELNKRGITP